ncbi:MAG: HD domain-containing protein [Candidatus Melainabacteria bacterium]|jgi:poly(A) polymerase|nr:HD domain-containing protein [Candidatus Melainabacteria bacterium]
MNKARNIGKAVCRKLQKHGKLGLFAGGCVRDKKRKKTPKDYDVVTNATPEEIKRIFKRDTCLLVGEAFGIIMVIRQGVQIEIATLRGDGQYSDARRPDSVIFLNDLDPIEALRRDAERRDLTINAMYEDPISGVIYDFFGGMDDIENGIIRAVGDPVQRITEDPLRMLRVARFAAKLGFEVHPTLLTALKQNAAMLRPGTAVAFERIANELEGILLSAAPTVGLELLMETGLMGQFLPEMLEMTGEKAMGDPIWHPEGSAWVHTMMVVAQAAKEEEKSFEFMLGVFLHDIAKPRTMTTRVEVIDGAEVVRVSNKGHAEVGCEMAKVICRRLKLSADTTQRVSEIVRLHMQMHDYNDPTIRRSKVNRLMSRPDIMDLIKMQHADCMGTGRPLAERQASSHREYYLGLLEAMKNDPTPSMRAGASQLLDGRMIIARGFKPGPIFRVIKEAGFEAQADGEFTDAEGAEKWLDERVEGYRAMTQADITAALAALTADASEVKPVMAPVVAGSTSSSGQPGTKECC